MGRGRGAATLAAAAALAVSGCGGSDEELTTPETLAGAAPGDSLVYVEGAIRPSGGQKAALEAIAERFPGGANLAGLITESLDEDLADDAPSGQTPPSYEEDIEPWLGERGALALTGLGESDVEDDTPGAYIFETTDPAAAAVAIPRLGASAGKPPEEREWEGVTYYVSSEGSVRGMVGDLAAGATSEAIFKSLVEAVSGESPSLEDAEGFSYEVGEEDGSEILGFAHLELASLIETEIEQEPDPEVTSNQFMDYAREAGFDLEEPLTLALTATPAAARLDTSLGVTDSDMLEGAEELLETGPKGAWAAATCPGCLEIFKVLFDFGVARAASGGGLSAEDLNGVIGAFGLDTDVLAEALGPAAFFVRGEAPRMTGAFVVSVKDEEPIPAALDAAVAVLAGNDDPAVAVGPLRGRAFRGLDGFTVSLPDFPLPLLVVLKGDRLVLADGQRLAVEALEPSPGSAGSRGLRDLDRQLGEGFDRAGYAEAGPIISLARAATGGDADFLEALPYLKPLRRLGLGARIRDGRLILRTAVTFGERGTP